ncbi:TetR/AcrR family transcriptional regulator [Pelosinus sp. sgz500959]|uniref:TetR/AcrR family transcriptional regulator n=1 Tax=Pelosinus sp. sgz500959 TaxID=3242472 RepID=UPI00366DD619
MKYNRSCICTHDSQNKRQQILDAAYIVFSRKGYHRATVDEIIALADTGKGTVYNYFTNKEQLFYTLIKERSTPFEGILENIVTSSEEPLQKVQTIVKAFLEFYQVNAELWRVVMYEVRGIGVEGYSNFTLEQRDKYQAWFCRSIGMIEKVLIEGKEQGAIVEKCDANRVAHSLFSVIVTSVFRNFVSEDIGETAYNITEFLLYGVAKK